MILFLLFPSYLVILHASAHIHFVMHVPHIKKDPFNHMPSNNIFWERYMENICTEQLIWAAALMRSQILCRTDWIFTGYSFCIFTVFLAQFHPPSPEKGIYSTPAMNRYRDAASCMERFNGAGQCPVQP